MSDIADEDVVQKGHQHKLCKAAARQHNWGAVGIRLRSNHLRVTVGSLNTGTKSPVDQPFGTRVKLEEKVGRPSVPVSIIEVWTDNRSTCSTFRIIADYTTWTCMAVGCCNSSLLL